MRIGLSFKSIVENVRTTPRLFLAISVCQTKKEQTEQIRWRQWHQLLPTYPTEIHSQPELSLVDRIVEKKCV